MQTTIGLRPGDWIDERTILADIHSGEVSVIHATELTDTVEQLEKEALRLQQRRRQRVTQARYRQRLREAIGRLS